MASLDHANYRSCQLAIGMVPQLSRFEAALDLLLRQIDVLYENPDQGPSHIYPTSFPLKQC